MIATLVLAALTALDTCAGCGVERREARLCEPHAQEERSVLARETRRLDSQDEAERLAALDEIAALTEAYANAPSGRVAKRIADALADESFAVRARAVERLGPPQHALEALDALTKALAGTAKEMKSTGSRWERLGEKLQDKLPDARRQETLAERKECERRMDELRDLRNALVARLAGFPDERALDAILAHTHRNLIMGNDEALILLGSGRAVRAIADSFRTAEENLAAMEVEFAEVKRRSGPDTLLTGLATVALDNAKDAYAKHRAELVELLTARGATPPAATAGARAWRAWIENHAAGLQERLPGIASPAW